MAASGEVAKKKTEKEKSCDIPAVAKSSVSSSEDRLLIEILKNTRMYCKA